MRNQLPAPIHRKKTSVFFHPAFHGSKFSRLCRQDKKNRQNSTNDLTPADIEWFEQQQIELNSKTMSIYNEALDRGIAKESARFLLPMATKTLLFSNGNIRSWMHYLELRLGNGTQKNILRSLNKLRPFLDNIFP